MSVTIPEHRWWNAWVFLSLDMIDPFSNDLWLSFLDLMPLRNILREEIGPYIGHDDRYFDMKEVINARILDRLHNDGHPQFEQMVCWVRQVFEYGGSDRIYVRSWKQIATKTFRDPNPAITGKLALIMSRLGQRAIEAGEYIRTNIRAPQGATPWDEGILAMEELTCENVLTTIRLIMYTNRYLELWNEEAGGLNITELEELYRYGKLINNEICFPNSWRYELNGFCPI